VRRTGERGEREHKVGDESGEAAYGLEMSFGFVQCAAARAPEVSVVCGDAARLPFKDGSVRAVTVSFGLHDKRPELRHGMLEEARRVLGPGGKLIAVDFESPWNAKSRMEMLLARAAEWLAGGELYQNGSEFLRRGGLRGFLRDNGFIEVSWRDVATGSLIIVVSRPDAENPL
jgi:demethylmenaquinone methyltransferase/2-methoxy-6-polyprenyl-1,4-benzoquinol methylase